MQSLVSLHSLIQSTILVLVGFAIHCAAMAGDAKVQNDIVFAIVDGHKLKLDLYMPAEQNPPLLMWIHGGGWRAGSKNNCPVSWLVQHGYAVASISYRLTDKAIFPAQIHDCKAALRWLRANAAQYGYQAKRIAVAGSSAGGHLAALMGTSGGVQELEGMVGGNLAQSSRVDAVIDFYGATDFVLRSKTQPHRANKEGSVVHRLLGGGADKKVQLAKLASPASHVSKNDPPFLVFHGAKDNTVLLDQSERIQQLYKDAKLPLTLHVLKKSGHGGKEFFSGRQRDLIVEFLDTHLQEKPAKKTRKKQAPFMWVNPLPKRFQIPGLKHATFKSHSMNRDVGYCIYLPPQYAQAQASKSRFPVVYYLHGGRPGSEVKSVGLARYIHKEISQDNVAPMIYVFVNGGPVSHYNMPKRKQAMGEDIFIKELIPHIDASYRTISNRTGRGLEGFSQGGRGTCRIMFKHPQLFCSAAPGGGGYATEKRISENDGWENDTLQFTPGDNTWDLAREFDRNSQPEMKILIHVGTKGFNYKNNLEYMKFLDNLKIPYQKLIVKDAPHSAKIIYEKNGLQLMKFHEANFAGQK